MPVQGRYFDIFLVFLLLALDSFCTMFLVFLLLALNRKIASYNILLLNSIISKYYSILDIIINNNNKNNNNKINNNDTRFSWQLQGNYYGFDFYYFVWWLRNLLLFWCIMSVNLHCGSIWCIVLKGIFEQPVAF